MIRKISHHHSASQKPSGTLLGFDYGAWRIGIAVGEVRIASARALTTLVAGNAHQIDWPAIAKLIETWQPTALVVGWPIRDDGTPYPVADYIERFARRLHGRFDLPVLLVDERLSSEEAERRLTAEKRRRQAFRKSPELLDAEAAAIILETYHILAGEPGRD